VRRSCGTSNNLGVEGDEAKRASSVRGEAYEFLLGITLYCRVPSDVALLRFERSAGKFEAREDSKTWSFKDRRFGQLDRVSNGKVHAGAP